MAPAFPIDTAALAAGDYLTDGRVLYRVVLSPSLGMQPAVLEDCRTLEYRACRVPELAALRLTLVRRGPDALAA